MTPVWVNRRFAFVQILARPAFSGAELWYELGPGLIEALHDALARFVLPVVRPEHEHRVRITR